MALRTITPKHQNLRQISIHAHLIPSFTSTARTNARQAAEELIFEQWSELDQVLAQLWESHSIRAEVLYYRLPPDGKQDVNEFMRRLLPEIMGRGAIDLVRRTW